ncbi:MAG: hypothetical protein QOJ65_2092 [Fimbriimonadaceae bacterium]|jgi:hypothetical protein|nr:hypothetical protein [Fimbriimonadaceae bacterium]
MTFRELGRALSALGTPEDRVKVLDVDYSATTFQLPQIEQRVRVGVFYLRPPTGVPAQDIKELLDECPDLEFRYKVTSGIGTDHVELLTPDDYAKKFFSSSNNVLRIEGSRKIAREQLEEIFDEMKQPFDPESFPHLDRVTISAHNPGNEESSTEVKLLAFDGDFRNMSRLERDIANRFIELFLHREIAVGRHLVKDTRPEVILSTTAKATAKGSQFLNSLAMHLLGRDGGFQTEMATQSNLTTNYEEPAIKPTANPFPKVKAPATPPAEIVREATNQFYDTLVLMSSFKDLEVKKMPQRIHVQFPNKILGGRRFDERELKELKAVAHTLLGSPGLHEGWNSFYLYDKSERLLKIRLTTKDEKLESPWSKLGKD